MNDAANGAPRQSLLQQAIYVCGGLFSAVTVGGGTFWVLPGLMEAPPATITVTTTTTTTFTTTSYPLTRNITFVTAETRGDPIIVRVGDFTERFRTEVVNLGEGEKWKGYKSKVQLWQKYLDSRLDSGDGDELVSFVDGSDVIWGGCDPGYFQHAYEEIARKSGAKVIFSAELACGEQDCNKVPDVPQWAIEVADDRPLDKGFWEKYVDGCKGTWTDECSARRDCGKRGACSKPPAVKFLNSGFVIGPIRDMKKLMDWSLDYYDKWSVWGDQSVFAVYWLNNLDDVTLDYTGALAASISDMRWELLEPPLDCTTGDLVYIISHRDYHLHSDNGKVNFVKGKNKNALWKLTKTEDGRYFITSSDDRQLVDNSNHFVSTSIFKSDAEKWEFSVGGGGVVYITSPRKEQLQDDNGKAVFSPNKQGWESWRIHNVDGTKACVERRPKDGVVMNTAFNRKQCLIHGNGRGFWFFKHIVRMLTNKSVDDVRAWGKHTSLHTG